MSPYLAEGRPLAKACIDGPGLAGSDGVSRDAWAGAPRQSSDLRDRQALKLRYGAEVRQ